MAILRDGQRSDSPLLDRLVYFDERSRAFPVREAVEATGAKRPRSYTWHLGATVLDQGSEGACVGFAVTHELVAKPAVVPGLSEESALALYYDAQMVDPWPGGSYPGASPRYEGTSVLAGMKTAKDQGYYSEYRWGFGLDDLVMGVGYGGPAVLGLNWYEGMFRPGADGYIRPAGVMVGGHAIVCLGVNLAERAFLLANSWGQGWSAALWRSNPLMGHCKLSFSDAERLLHENGEAAFPTRVRL